MCYLRASVLFISFRFLTCFSFLFFYFCFVSFLTILFSFFCVSFFSVSFRYFSPCFLFVFFLSVSFRFFSFFSVSQFTGTPLCKPWMTHTNQKTDFQWGPFRKINKFNIDKTNKKNWAKTFAVEISHIMTYNNAKV